MEPEFKKNFIIGKKNLIFQFIFTNWLSECFKKLRQTFKKEFEKIKTYITIIILRTIISFQSNKILGFFKTRGAFNTCFAIKKITEELKNCDVIDFLKNLNQ